jgi:hypothetical protein
VIPMYNPEVPKPTSARALRRPGSTSTAIGRTLHNPNRSHSGGCGVTPRPNSRSTCTTWAKPRWSMEPTSSTSSR